MVRSDWYAWGGMAISWERARTGTPSPPTTCSPPPPPPFTFIRHTLMRRQFFSTKFLSSEHRSGCYNCVSGLYTPSTPSGPVLIKELIGFFLIFHIKILKIR